MIYPKLFISNLLSIYHNTIKFHMEGKKASEINKDSFVKSPEINLHTPFNFASHKQMSTSAFLEPDDRRYSGLTTKRGDYPSLTFASHAEDLTRARSLKGIDEGKPRPVNKNNKALGDINQETLRLKSEELLFKLKLKCTTLLQQININEVDLTRFSKISKVDDIMHFLSQKIKGRFAQLSNNSSAKSNGCDLITIQKLQSDIEGLRKKLIQRQNNQKQLKIRLKDINAETKELYDKINIKEKDYSMRVTQIYQLKAQLKQQERLIEGLKHKLGISQHQKSEIKSQMDNGNRNIIKQNQGIFEENEQLKSRVSQLEEELGQERIKLSQLQIYNSQINQELTRWRERFEFEKESQDPVQYSESDSRTPQADLTIQPRNQLKKSTMSMTSAYINNFQGAIRYNSTSSLEIQNVRLTKKVKELEKENNQLSREILNHSSFKEKYSDTLTSIGQISPQLQQGLDNKKLDFLKQRSIDLYKLEVEGHYKRKSEQIAREWKEKVYEVVCRYQDQIQLLKNEIRDLNGHKITSEKHILALATEKYEIQKKFISFEKDFTCKMKDSMANKSQQGNESNNESVLILNEENKLGDISISDNCKQEVTSSITQFKEI